MWEIMHAFKSQEFQNTVCKDYERQIKFLQIVED